MTTEFKGDSPGRPQQVQLVEERKIRTDIQLREGSRISEMESESYSPEKESRGMLS